MRTLYIVTAVSNPMLWESRISLAEKAFADWLKEPNVNITVVECAYGTRGYQLSHLQSNKLKHIGVRAKTLLWIKENLLNIGIQNLPKDADYIATLDADIIWRHKGWAHDIVNALDLYPVVQPWEYCLDLGPNNGHTAVHKSFAALHREGKPVVPRFDDKTLHLTNSPYHYPHPGYAMSWRKDFLDHVGGLFEWGGVGAGDHHMVLAMVKNCHMSIPKSVNGNYKSM